MRSWASTQLGAVVRGPAELPGILPQKKTSSSAAPNPKKGVGLRPRAMKPAEENESDGDDNRASGQPQARGTDELEVGHVRER